MKKARIIFLIVGCIILFLLFKAFGVDKIITHLEKMGWNFFFIILIYFFNNIVLTSAWTVLINYQVKLSKFYKFFLARVAGDSTASINLMGALAGEPIKALYIQSLVPFKAGLASVVMDRTIHTVANLLMVLTGICISFFVIDLPPAASFGFMSFILVVLCVMIFVLKKQRDGFIEYLIKKIPGRLEQRVMNEKRWENVRNLDSEIGNIFTNKNNLRHFYTSLGIRYVSIFISGTLEVFLILQFIDINIPILHSMFVYIFGLIMMGIIFFVPGNLAVSEGSYSLALQFLGYDPALGLTVGIVRRLRTLAWAGIGMMILFHAGLLHKEKSNETRANS